MRVSLAQIETVYRDAGASFFRLAVARLGDADAAHDAVQEGFARAIRGRDSFRGSGSVEAWVARCVINAAYDLARRDARDRAQSTQDADATEASAPATTVPSEGDHVLRRAVARLPQRQRDVLFLRHYLDFDYATIAATLEIEVGTVSATLYAARSALAQELQEVAP